MSNWNDISFDQPLILWGLLIIPLLILVYIKRSKSNNQVKISSVEAWRDQNGTSLIIHTPFILKMIGIGFLIIALARPQSSSSWSEQNIEGIDIMLTLDISGSMMAMDFKPNRLEATKDIAKEFINQRHNDRIGMVVFGQEGFTQCPLTSDHDILKNLIGKIECGWLGNGTAIGQGIATSVKRLKESDAKSKVLILLTDGENNAGKISPNTAAELAKTFGITIYSIGVGSRGKVDFPVQDIFGRSYIDKVEMPIDEKTLSEIATSTGGKYFRAESENKLRAIYEEIDQLEKTKISGLEFRKQSEEYRLFAIIGLLTMLTSFLMQKLILKGLSL